ncbi:hypothetical protein V8C35DRAFT_240923 [Trichoderma chlorosporum]
MGFCRPVAKLEVKLEMWRARTGRAFEQWRAGPDVDIDEWRQRKQAAKARKAAWKKRRREQRRAYTWRDYIPFFPEPIGFTPLWRLDDMMASKGWMGEEYNNRS